MLAQNEIRTYLEELGTELCTMGVKGELCLFGGAVMCLAYQARPSTKDVDAIFEPTSSIRLAAQHIADAHNLREDWLNDAVKGFVVPHPQRTLYDFPCLKVYIPEADYLLVMKAMAARVDTQDKADIEFLIKKLDIRSPEELFKLIENYYPRQQVKPATRFFIEELFDL
jgi:hypothetical protein